MFTSFKPQFYNLRPWRHWAARQRFNFKIGLEYFKYRRRLSGKTLAQYQFSGPAVNQHIQPVINRPLDRPLRIFGCWVHYNWENYNLLPALQVFGQVTHYNPQSDYSVPYDGTPPDLAARSRMQEKVWQLVSSGQPWDLLYFYISGANFDPEFVQRLQTLGVPLVNFGHDDIVFFEDEPFGKIHRGVVDIAPHFTLYCCTSEIGFYKALAVGATPYYMPGGANPLIYRQLPGIERDLDVVFVGARFYDRAEVIDYLQQQGINVTAYGYGWPNGTVSNEQQIELLNRAKIVVGFNRCNGSDWLGIKGRDHEVPMTGAFHLVNDFAEIRNVYQPGLEVGVYRNPRHLVQQINYYLAHPQEREQIAAAGQQRAVREHSWQARFGALLTRLGLLSPEYVASVSRVGW